MKVNDHSNIKKEFETYKELLTKLIKFKSISTDNIYLGEISGAADWLVETLKAANFSVEKYTDYGNPIILAEYQVDINAPTIIIYGHYDVQPASQDDGWATDPFELNIIAGKLIGRGVADNKGQFLIYLATIINLIKDAKLAVNIKFLLEGNEESGSEGLESFFKVHNPDLKGDLWLISDSTFTTHEEPALELGARGNLNATLILKTANHALHSGMYGGTVPNPIHEAAKLIAKLFGPEDKLNLANFYTVVEEIPQTLLSSNSKLANVNEYLAETTTKTVFSEANVDYLTQAGLRPTIQITGIQSGYVGQGYRNEIPNQIQIKFNLRLVANQDALKIKADFETYIANNIAKYVDYQLDFTGYDNGVKFNLDKKYTPQIKSIVKEIYHTEPVEAYSGGTLPVLAFIEQYAKLPVIAIGLANSDCKMHAVGENFRLDYLENGLKFTKRLLTNKFN